MPVITVSRQRGSMGSYIALEVARKLELRYLDREIIQSVAREAGIEAEAVEAIEEKAGRLARVRNLLNLRPKLPSAASASISARMSAGMAHSKRIGLVLIGCVSCRRLACRFGLHRIISFQARNGWMLSSVGWARAVTSLLR